MALRVPSSPSLRGSVAFKPRRQRAGTVHRSPDVELLEGQFQAFRAESARAGERLRGLDGRELGGVQHQLPQRVDGRELEDRDVELLRPLSHRAERLGCEAVALHRLRGRLAGGAEPDPAQPEVLHHQLLLRQRQRIELDPDLLRLDEVLGDVERIGDLEQVEVHRGIIGADVQLADVHLGAEELGAHFLGRVLRDRLGEEPDQDRDDREEQDQRPDGLPAEDLHGHAHSGRKRR